MTLDLLKEGNLFPKVNELLCVGQTDMPVNRSKGNRELDSEITLAI